MKLEAVMVTDVGVVRDHNEDSAHVDPHHRFFIVADGMGGHAAGEVASAMAVDTVRKTLEASTAVIDGFTARPTDNARRALVQLLQSAVLAAHQAVFQRGSRESDKAGMGTTLDVLLIAGQEAFVAHVGDSRTYLIRDGKAAQLTTDHTVAEVLVIEGKLTIEEALVSPYRTVLVNAIGVAADVGVEMAHLQLRAADKLLLCSDGLHDYFLAEQELADALGPAAAPGAKAALTHLVETAKDRGGHDNITGVVVTIVDLAEAVPATIEQDQTLPVDLPAAATAWNDDERTENITPKDAEKLGGAPPMPGVPPPPTKPEDIASRPTAPMAAIRPPKLPGDVSGTDATDPHLKLPDSLRAEGKGKAIGGEDPTEPALDASAVKAALARARAEADGAEDPTRPSSEAAKVRSALGRATTEPPPLGATDDDATVDRKAVKPAGAPAAERDAGDPGTDATVESDATDPAPKVDKVG